MPRSDPLGGLHPIRRTIRYYLSRLVIAFLTRAWLRFEVEGRERLPRPGDLCVQPPVMGRSLRADGDAAVPAAAVVLRAEGGGHAGPAAATGDALDRKRHPVQARQERPARGDPSGRRGDQQGRRRGDRGGGADRRDRGPLLPLNDGPAYFALRSQVPLVPIAINGTSWLRFGARVRVRIGEPIVGEGRPDRAAVDAMTATLATRLQRRCGTTPRARADGSCGGAG